VAVGTFPAERDLASWLIPAIIQSSDGIVLSDARGIVVWANPAWEAAHGVAAGEAAGRELAEFHGRANAGAYDAFLRLAHERHSHEGELEHERLDGSRFASWTRVQIVRHGVDLRDALVWTVRDVSERNRTAAALQELGKRFRSVVQSARDAILVARDDRSILVWNAAAERMFEARESDVVGLPLDGLFVERERPEIVRRLAPLLGVAEPPSDGILLESLAVSRGGHEFPVEVAFSAFPSGRGRFASAIVRDVTERKEAEAKLREALLRARESDRLKSAFLDNVSHEIRTPVNVIGGTIAILADRLRESGDPTIGDSIDAIERASKRLVDSLGRTLDFAKLASGEAALRPARLRIGELLEEEVSAYEALAREKGLELRAEISEPRLAVFADRHAVGRALANLIDNAIKFTARGFVRVAARRDPEGAVEILVEDSGVGIAPSFRARLFEPFTQEEMGHDRRYEGQGLGLAVAARYLEIAGATIGVESEKGTGSRFRIRFPPPPRRNGRSSGIVVVGAAAGLAPWREAAFRLCGVEAVETVEAASPAFADEDSGCRALVLGLDAGDVAFALVRRLRGHRLWWDLPILGWTDDAEPRARGRAIAAGVDQVFAPPFEVERALEALRRLLD
jgi:PAS domain S-box-containing protein